MAIWLGLISATREVVKERTILRRELAIGVRLRAYLASKLVVLGVLTLVQILLLSAVAFAIQPIGGASAADYAAIVILLLSCSWAAATMGLAVSALARSVDQATSFVPLLLIPQLLFAGAVVPVESMQAVPKAISYLVVARWGFASSGDVVDMNPRLSGSPPDREAFGTDFFTVDPAVAVAVITAFALGGLVVAALLLRRRSI